ncbi:MAG: bifunctional adenosylcobinamide kinase/adenosylcobinamide-phosphate guanylyltransferase [Clostridia bacterium]|nr:bifunctional adenosylcobinamide kinase/adenosylcobinamide-phosphate guanylyltransferase [Clostridia bacterium]
MGRLTLIMGENDSGKSAFAEGLFKNTNKKRYYIATMIPVTDENRARIEKHRAAREGLRINTLELSFSVGGADIAPDSAVLLEDVSNLLANAVFEKKKTGDDVYRDICALKTRCAHLCAVTISGLDGGGYDSETADYINALRALNARLYDDADTVVLMKDKKPIYLKGSYDDVI